MALSDITRPHVLSAIEEFEELGRKPFLAKYGYGEALTYYLAHDGRRYDSKAVVGVAHGYARPDLNALANTDLTGGDKQVGDLLRTLGFEVAEETPRRRNPVWSRDELILALDYYLTHPGEAHDPGKAAIIALSVEINAIARMLGAATSETLRNPNGVSMKLLNFRAHDPQYTARGRAGLSRGNRLEGELWSEFSGDTMRLSGVAANIRAAISQPDSEALANQDEPEIAEAAEGRLITRMHRTRERNRSLVKRKKSSFEKKHGSLFCEACGFDFGSVYGGRGEGFIECHHTQPIAMMEPGEKTKLTDLALLCANCHRMVHVRTPWLTVDQLRALVRQR
ncbi:MAG: HNH endonuclease [Hyphomicrobiales bacterium]|uniref:HNH endonuclease n=1 Tax=Shimia thalassica TaxID=1715693 RepID=UPI0032976DBC